MTLTLKESCRMYEQYCRRRTAIPTFEEFNHAHATCLPRNKVAFQSFKQTVEAAVKAEGVPVTRRLPSLFQKFSLGDQPALVPPSVQLAARPPVLALPSPKQSFTMNIRQPVAESAESVEAESAESVEAESAESVEPWSVESYKDLVLQSDNSNLRESKGLMVHLIPPEKETELVSLACKLTKSTWNAICGKSGTTLSMRDGSVLDLSSIQLKQEDVAKFVSNYKKKVAGPFFLRFSRI